ncbi:MAG TPA: DoxX family protein [Actinobacteria bacterium]|nr:DoxX family protein [Actinomycetota bacterium]
MRVPTDATLLALRLTLAIVFLGHGWRHARHLSRTAAWAGSIGLRRPRYQAMTMAYGELAIGLGLGLGLATAAAAAGAVAMMAVAFWTVHRRAGFFVSARPDEGWEYVFVVAVVAVSVATLGAGEWSLDHVLGWSGPTSGRAGALIATSGLVLAAGHLAAYYRRVP